MPVNKDKTRRFAINLPIQLAEQVDALAASERRSVASWLRNAIEDKVKESSSDATTGQHDYSKLIAAAAKKVKADKE